MFTDYTVATAESYDKAFGNPFEVHQRQGSIALNFKAVIQFLVTYLNTIAKEWRKAHEKATGNKLKVTNVNVINGLFDANLRATADYAHFPKMQGAEGAVALFEKMRPFARTLVYYDGKAFKQYIENCIKQLPSKAPELVSKAQIDALFTDTPVLDKVIVEAQTTAKAN